MNAPVSDLLAPYSHCVRPTDWDSCNKYVTVNVGISGPMTEGKYQSGPNIDITIEGPEKTKSGKYEISGISCPQGHFKVSGNTIRLPNAVAPKLAAMLIGKSLDHLIELPDCSAIITKVNGYDVTYKVIDVVPAFKHTKESWNALRYNNRINDVLDQMLPASLKQGFDALSDDDLKRIIEDIAHSEYSRFALLHNNQYLTVSINIKRSLKANKIKISKNLIMKINQDYVINDNGHISIPVLSEGVTNGMEGMDAEKIIEHWVFSQAKVRKATAKLKKTIVYLDFEKMTLREMLKDRLSLIERKDHPLLLQM